MGGREKLTFEFVKAVFESRGCRLLETEYRNSKEKLRYIAVCGHERSSSFDNFSRGKGDLCPKCRQAANGRSEAIGHDRILAAFEEAGMKVLNDDFYRTTDPVHYIALCGHENTTDYAHFVGQGNGRVCAACSKSVQYSYDYVREAFENKGCELLEKEYVNCKTPMRYIATCGHEAVITFDTFLNAPGASLRCRSCHKHTYHEHPSDRNRTASKVWRKAVYERDGFTCQVCGKHGGDLNAHHLNAYDSCEEQRFALSNGITLCPACHTKFHAQYGFGGNTKEQFFDWIKGNTEVSRRIKKRLTP